jgi:nuclear receptor co-repressor 1
MLLESNICTLPVLIHKAFLQMQQAVQQYHQHQQLQQQQQQQQQQDQALAQVQAHMQAQVLAIAQAQAQAQAQAHVQAQAQAAAAQVHAHVQEHEQASQHPPLTQPPRKPLTKIALQQQQQQQQKPLTKTVLQQQQQGAGLHHHHDQQQHGQSLGLLRGSIQALTPSSVTELSNQQVDMVELREAKLRHLCPEELQNQLSAVVQQASSAQQQQAVQPARPSPSSTVDAPQQIRPGDIKLFGQSLLSQPSLNVGPQSALHQAASSANERGALHQPFYPTLSAPSSTVTKPSGAPSAFGRVQAPFMLPEGRQASWPTLGSHSGNMGLWSMMNGLQGAATSLTKSSEREARSQHAMQETMPHKNDCFAQDSRELEGEQAMGALPLHLKHLEQLCSIQELRRNEGLAKMVPVSDQRGGGGAGPSVVIGVSDANEDSRIDTDKRCDHSQGLSSSTGQIDCYRRGDLSQGLSGANQIDGEGRKELSQGLNGANQIDDERRNELSQGGLSDPLMGSSNRATSESTGMQGVPSATSNQQMPRTVMDALIAINDWHNSRSLPGHAPSGSVPQQSLEQQVWENFFRRESNNNGGSESVKTNPVFGLPASLATTAHLSGPEVLQQCVRDSSMYFTPQHMLSLAGQRVNNAGAWNNGNRLMHTTESQLQMPMLPTITPFHSCPLSRGTTATDEHLRPVDSRGPDSTTGGVS